MIFNIVFSNNHSFLGGIQPFIYYENDRKMYSVPFLALQCYIQKLVLKKLSEFKYAHVHASGMKTLCHSIRNSFKATYHKLSQYKLEVRYT